MRALQKISRNGNASSVTIPKAMLVTLGWLPGESVVVFMTEDRSILLRRPREADFAPASSPRLSFPDPELVKG